jgi:hypothetical protein
VLEIGGPAEADGDWLQATAVRTTPTDMRAQAIRAMLESVPFIDWLQFHRCN